MGVTDRLLAKLRVDDTELSGVDGAELQAELEARVAERTAREPKSASENARSRFADASANSAATRAQMAERRRKKVHAIRGKRESERKREEDEAFRRVKEQARQPRPPRRRSGTGAADFSSTGGWRERAASGLGGLGRDKALADAYKVLDLPYGAAQDQVKTAFRKLMRKYHPDLHNQAPKKQKAATELTMKVTQAYNVLESHFKKN